MDEMDKSNPALWQQVDALKRQMPVVEKVECTQRKVKEEGWEREADPRLVIASVQSMVGRTNL